MTDKADDTEAKYIAGYVKSTVNSNDHVDAFEDAAVVAKFVKTTISNEVQVFVWANETATVKFGVKTGNSTTYITSDDAVAEVTNEKVYVFNDVDTDNAEKQLLAQVATQVTEEVTAAKYSDSTLAQAQAIVDKWHDWLGDYGLGVSDLTLNLSSLYTDLNTSDSFSGTAPTGRLVMLGVPNVDSKKDVEIDVTTTDYTATLKYTSGQINSNESVTVTYEGQQDNFVLGLDEYDTGDKTASIPAGKKVTVTVVTDRSLSKVEYKETGASGNATAATKSAVRRASAARGEMSPRLPMGVGTRIRVPVMGSLLP